MKRMPWRHPDRQSAIVAQIQGGGGEQVWREWREDGGEWAVDGGRWTVDSGQWEEAGRGAAGNCGPVWEF
jgi:hypothetical protein